MQELRKERPTIKLLYITPEQLVASAALVSALQALQSRGLLARFVVDEVRGWQGVAWSLASLRVAMEPNKNALGAGMLSANQSLPRA